MQGRVFPAHNDVADRHRLIIPFEDEDLSRGDAVEAPQVTTYRLSPGVHRRLRQIVTDAIEEKLALRG